MRITSFLDGQDVLESVKPGSKKEVLSALIQLFCKNHPTQDPQMLMQILLQREELRSTGIEKGVAFPHGRVPGLRQLHSVFGRCQEGVDFQSFDNQPTYFFFLLLIPEQSEGSHLKALARLNRIFQDEEFRQRLHNAKTSADLYQAIVEQDSRC